MARNDKENTAPLGTEAFDASRSYYEANTTAAEIQDEAQRRAERAKRAKEWRKEKWKSHPAQMFATRATLIGMGMLGVSGNAALASSGVILYNTHKGIRKAYDGQSLRDHRKNWVKYAGLSEFQDHDNGLVQQRYQYYSNVKFQHLDRNCRDTVLSWFGLDSEYRPTDYIAEDARRDHESYQIEKAKEDEENRIKEEQKRRNQMFLPNVLSMTLMRLMQDPYFRDYVSKHQFGYDDPESDADIYGAENAVPYDKFEDKSNKQQTADAYTDDGDDNSHDGPNGGGGGGNHPDGPVPIGPSDPGAYALPYDEELNWNHYLDPNVAYARVQLSNDMKQSLPDFYNAYQNSVNKWQDVDDETLVNDIQTLHDYGKMDRLMKGIESGEVATLEDLQNVETSYEQTWAEIEAKGVMPLYGDRIKSYMMSITKEDTPVKTAPEVLEVKTEDEAKSKFTEIDKQALREKILQSRIEAREAMSKSIEPSVAEPVMSVLPKNISQLAALNNPNDPNHVVDQVLAADKQASQKTIRDVIKSPEFASSMDKIIKSAAATARARRQAQLAQNAEPIKVEATVIDTEPKSESSSQNLLEDHQDQQNDVKRDTIVEMQQDVSTYGEAVPGRNDAIDDIQEAEAENGQTEKVQAESKPKNNRFIPASMRDVLAASEAEADVQYE